MAPGTSRLIAPPEVSSRFAGREGGEKKASGRVSERVTRRGLVGGAVAAAMVSTLGAAERSSRARTPFLLELLQGPGLPLVVAASGAAQRRAGVPPQAASCPGPLRWARGAAEGTAERAGSARTGSHRTPPDLTDPNRTRPARTGLDLIAPARTDPNRPQGLRTGLSEKWGRGGAQARICALCSLLTLLLGFCCAWDTVTKCSPRAGCFLSFLEPGQELCHG